MGNPMSMMGPPATGESLPKPQLVRILTEVHRLLMRKCLIAKRENIRERIQYYKVDPERYKNAIMSYMMRQPQLIQESMVEICANENIELAALQTTISVNMEDPEVQSLFVKFQTISADMCEHEPVPDSADEDTLKEVIRIQIAELGNYSINDPGSSLIAQTAVSDEVYQQKGLDEIQLGALILKYENSEDPELKLLKEQWNEKSKMEMVMPGASFN